MRYDPRQSRCAEGDPHALDVFHEQPLSTYPREASRETDDLTVLLLSNRHFNPVDASRLYNERLEEYLLAEEVGVDGIMLNEHHSAPFCMQAKCNIFAAVLAARRSA